MSGRASERPLYRLVLRPEPHIDGPRALRRFLKSALRSYGLRCINAVEITEHSRRVMREDEPEGVFRDHGRDPP